MILLYCEDVSGIWASLTAQLVKSPPAIQETPVQFLGGDIYVCVSFGWKVIYKDSS